MNTGFKQAGGLMHLASPFGADALLLDSLAGSEGLSELFRFTLQMRSASTSLRAAAAIGKEMTVSIGGSGQAVVWARQALSVSVAGSGDVSYYGEPQVTKSVMGSGSVKRLAGGPN